jgi:hypothetical protein
VYHHTGYTQYVYTLDCYQNHSKILVNVWYQHISGGNSGLSQHNYRPIDPWTPSFLPILVLGLKLLSPARLATLGFV